jgi:hypothetical protein
MIVGHLALLSNKVIRKLQYFCALSVTLHFYIIDVATNEPFPGNFIYALHPTVYIYIDILVVETVFLGMALRKAWLHRPSQGGIPLDSVFYFFMYIVSRSSIISPFYKLTICQDILSVPR